MRQTCQDPQDQHWRGLFNYKIMVPGCIQLEYHESKMWVSISAYSHPGVDRI